MPFRKVFEKRVNENMSTSPEAGPSDQPNPPSPLPSPSAFADTDVKEKCPPSPIKASSVYEEATDLDLSRKPDKSLPPRFSTLFDTHKPPPTPRVVECCHRSSEKSKRGVYLSTPVFVLLVVVLLFESTLLFAYTVIGLYQNLPAGFAGVMGVERQVPVDGCRCEEWSGRGAVNFAPNFVFGSEDARMMSGLDDVATMVKATTATESSSTETASSASSDTSSTTTTSTSIDSTAVAAASQLLDILSDATKDQSTTSIAIVTSTPGVVQSTILVTSSVGSGEETGSEARPTVTSVKVVDGPDTTIQARDAEVTGMGS